MSRSDSEEGASRRVAIGVVGGGTMGAGIAVACLESGLSVVVVEPRQTTRETLQDRLHRVAGSVAVGEGADGRPTAHVQEDLAGLTCERAIIESVPERPELKRTVLHRCERALGAEAILCTNTSGIPLSSLAQDLDDASRFVGTHFFNPVHRLRFIEIVRGAATHEETLGQAEALARDLQREYVVVRDSPGFVTARVSVLIGNEAMRLLEDGVATASDIDTAVRAALRHPMGPLELGDLIGWDTRLDIMEQLAESLGDRFAPTDLHRQLVREGRFGRKSGQGVYSYGG